MCRHQRVLSEDAGPVGLFTSFIASCTQDTILPVKIHCHERIPARCKPVVSPLQGFQSVVKARGAADSYGIHQLPLCSMSMLTFM